MAFSENTKYIVGSIGILLLGGFFVYFQYSGQNLFPSTQIVTPVEVHVHSDFLFYILDKRVDLTADKYQTTKTHTLKSDIHFHDNVDTQIHRHANGVTLADFLRSLGFTLTNDCITTDESKTYCSDDTDKLLLLVNGVKIENITSYITQQADQILLYYGDPNSPNISTYESQITNDACLYSGTCPERGKPPFETCGLTCEI